MTDTPAPAPELPIAERTRVLLPGLYAWLLTVELPTLARGARAGARVTALLAVATLVGALIVGGRRSELGRLLGIYAFLGLCALTWALLGTDFSPVHLDRVRTA